MSTSIATISKIDIFRISGCLSLTLSLLALLTVQSRAAVVASWIGGPSGNWSSAADWSTVDAPDNDALIQYHVEIDGGITGQNTLVTLNTNATIFDLTINSGDGLDIREGSTLTIDGTVANRTVTNDGTVRFLSTTSSADANWIYSGNVTLTGSGLVEMLDFNDSILKGADNTSLLTIESGQTIRGKGRIGDDTGRFLNRGTIRANSGDNLRINPGDVAAAFSNEGTLQANAGFINLEDGDFVNSGTIEAVGGGTVQTSSSSVDNTGGELVAAGSGSEVRISSTSVTNGTLRADGNGALLDFNGATISGAAIELLNGATGEVRNTDFTSVSLSGGSYTFSSSRSDFVNSAISDTSLTLLGNSTFDQGILLENTTFTDSSIEINTTNRARGLFIEGTLSVDGASSITLNDNSATIQGNDGGDLLINSATSTIEGFGDIGNTSNEFLALDNRGTITASTGSLWINTSDGPNDLINSGTLRGDGHTLFISDSDGTNSGTIEAVNGGEVVLSGVTLDNTGGTLSADGAGSVLDISSSVAITGGDIVLSNNATGDITGADFDSVSLTGDGFEFSSSRSDFVNSAISDTSLTLLGNSTSDQGILLDNTTFTDSSIEINTTDRVRGLFIEGTLSLDGASSITLNDSRATIQGNDGGDVLINTATSTIEGFGNIGNASNEFLALDNRGTITASTGFLWINTSDGPNDLINSGTLRGDGNILFISDSDGTNSGTIEAVNGGEVDLSGVTLDNTGGALSADGAGSVLDINSSVAITGGDIVLSNSATGDIWNADFTSVSLSGGSYTFSSSRSDFVNSAISDTSLTLLGNSTSDQGILLDNTTFTDSSIGINTTRSDSGLFIEGTLSLDGASSITLNANSATIQGNDGGDVLINTATSTIEGFGDIGNSSNEFLALDNRGTITASTGFLFINTSDGPNDLINSGTLRGDGHGLFISDSDGTNSGTIAAVNGGEVDLSGVTLDNTGGTLSSDGAGSVLDINSGVAITGGDIVLSNSATGDITGADFTGVTFSGGEFVADGPSVSSAADLDGVTIGSGTTLVARGNSTSSGNIVLQNTLTNNGLIRNDAQSSSDGIHVDGNVTVDGTGKITLNDNNAAIQGRTTGDTLVNSATHTIDGFGRLGEGTLAINNQGTIETAGGTLTIDASNNAGDLVNSGTIAARGTDTLILRDDLESSGELIIEGGAKMDSTATITQTAGNTRVDGELEVSSLEVQGGSVSGSGLIDGNVTYSGGGTLSPGNSAGELVISGDLTFDPATSLVVDLGGTVQGSEYDFLNTAGSIVVAGILDLNFINSFEGMISSSDVFTIVNAAGALSGSFANDAGGTITSANGLWVFDISYTSSSVTLSNPTAVPEPAVAVAVISLLSGAWVLFRRRKVY